MTKEGRKRKATDLLGTGGKNTHTEGGTHRATENRREKAEKKERKRQIERERERRRRKKEKQKKKKGKRKRKRRKRKGQEPEGAPPSFRVMIFAVSSQCLRLHAAQSDSRTVRKADSVGNLLA